MIERPRLPDCCAVADSAIVRILSRGVVGYLRRGEVGEMARVTVGVQSCVFSSDMTFNACSGDMSAGEREDRLGMVERRRIPRRCGMARGAIMIEAVCDVIRVRDTGEVRDVARITILRCPPEHSVLVTEDAIGRCVRTCEREARCSMAEC